MPKDIVITPSPAGYPEIAYTGASAGGMKTQVEDDGSLITVDANGVITRIKNNITDGSPAFDIHTPINLNNYYLLGDQTATNLASSGTVLKFDGINDYAYIDDTNLLTPAGKFSLEIRFKKQSPPSVTEQFVSKDTEWATVIDTNGTLRFRIYVASVPLWYDAANTTTNVCDGKEHHIVCTYDNTNMKVYVNGVLEVTTSHPGLSITNSNRRTFISSVGTTGAATAWYESEFGLVRFWNIDLSPSEAMAFSYGNVPYKYQGDGASDNPGSTYTSGTLVIGREYEITTYVAGDDFTNVGAASNASGVRFTATGTTPTTWSNASTLTRLGAVLHLAPHSISSPKWYDLSGNGNDATTSGVSILNDHGHSVNTAGDLVVARNIAAAADSTYNIGSSTVRFATGYFDVIDATSIIGKVTPSGLTAGSVTFVGSAGDITENNAVFFWDNSTNSLGIGTNTPAKNLDVVGTLGVSGAATISGATTINNDLYVGDGTSTPIINIIGHAGNTNNRARMYYRYNSDRGLSTSDPALRIYTVNDSGTNTKVQLELYDGTAYSTILRATGTSEVAGGLNTGGNLSVAGNISATGNLSITGTSTFSSTVAMPSPFTLGGTSVITTGVQLNYLSGANGTTGTGSIVFSASPSLTTPNIGAASGTSINLSGSASVGTTLSVTGATTLSSTLSVTGATTLSSTLGVTGATTLSGGLKLSRIANGTLVIGSGTIGLTDAQLYIGDAADISDWGIKIYKTTGNYGIRLDVDGTNAIYVNHSTSGNTFRVTGAGLIYAPSIGIGTDNSVVILDASGYLRTDEIDSRVWGTSLVDGGGNANYIAKWSDGNTVGNSIIYDTGTYVGIGTITPGYHLDVNGSIHASNKIHANYFKAGEGYNGNVSAGNWYRIASNSGSRANAEFTLRDYISSGGHSTATFRAGISYNQDAGISFTLLNHNYYGTVTFTKVRILRKTVYDPQYLEVYVNRTGSVDFSIYDNLQSGGWSPVAWAAGSIPTGYTSREFNINNLFAVGKTSSGFVIDRNHRVGIGTDVPAYNLDVSGTARMTGATIFSSTIQAGSIGIGTDNSVVILDASGYLRTDEIDSRVWGATLVDGSGTANYVTKWSDGNTVGNSIIYDTGTNVGIGNTSPAYKLHVSGDVYANGGWLRASGTGGVYFETYGGGWYMTDTTWIRSYGSKSIYHNSGTLRTDGTFQVGSSGSTLNVPNNGNLSYRTSAFFVNTSGNVGIGTNSPTSRVHIEATEPYIEIALKDKTTTGTRGAQILLSDGNNDGWLTKFSGGSTGQPLSVYPVNNGLSGSPIVTILDTGKVGINSSSPTYSLDVTGNGRFTTNLNVGGNLTVSGSSSFAGASFTATPTVNGTAVALTNHTHAAYSDDVRLFPEYAGAHFYEPNSSVNDGQFTMGWDSTTAQTAYYHWSSNHSSTLQRGGIRVEWQVPADFTSWSGIRLRCKTSNTAQTTNKIVVKVYKRGNTTALNGSGAGTTLAPGTTWSDSPIASGGELSSLIAGDVAIIEIDCYSLSSGYCYVGELIFQISRGAWA